MAMVANQLNDRVLFFEVNPRASNESLKLHVCRSTGGNHAAWGRMSHSRDHFSVTTYGENSVVISHKDSIGALSREMIHLNSNVASSFSVFSICSIMVDLNHVCHIRSDGLSFLSSSLINFDFWKQQMTSLVRTIPFPLHFCFCVIGLRKEPAVAVDLR